MLRREGQGDRIAGADTVWGMPLIPEQNVVSVFVGAKVEGGAIGALKRELESYPPVRIVAIDVTPVPGPLNNSMVGYHLTAVVETVHRRS